jgi:hypothetical protein
MPPPVAEITVEEQLRGEIARFVAAAKDRSDQRTRGGRRSQDRYRRSWPLVVGVQKSTGYTDLSAALHDASASGIAFLSPVAIADRSAVFIKLFWHEPDCPRVPAVVRHVTPTEHGYLIGCEFAPADASVGGLAVLRSQTPAE